MGEKIKPYVSIVVPVYNVSDYLEVCLESCRKQTLKNIEIICVNDGSTDNSLSILEEIAKKDDRIKIINKKNSGYGHTMNVGMEKANGEYIGIVESDDYVAPEMFEALYTAAKKRNLDIVKSDYYTFSANNKSIKKQYEKVCTQDKYYNIILDPKKTKEIFTFQMNTWTGIYKTSFLRENNIKHNETPGASYQDNGFWFQTLSLAQSVMFLKRAFYHYRQDNPNSSINSKGKVFCMNEEYAFIFDFIMKHPVVKKEFLNQFIVKKFFNYMYTYERIAEEYKLEFLKRFSEEFNELQASQVVNIYKLPNQWVTQMLGRIMDNYQLFYYDDTIFRLSGQLENAQMRLGKLKKSNEMLVGGKIAGVFRKIMHR